MPNLDLAFQFENGLAFTETDVAVFSSTFDPSIAGAVAAIGSAYLRSTGSAWLKTGALDTNWSRLLIDGDVSISISGPAAGIQVSGSPVVNSGTITLSLSNDLAALEGLAATGFGARTGADTWAVRTFSGGTNITVTNGDGVAGNPSIALSGIVATTLGGTGLSTIGAALQVLRVNAAGTALEYATPTDGTVTSVAATQPAAGITISGSPITSSGTLVFALANDLAAVEGLVTTGIAARTSADTWATRQITGTTNQIDVTNGGGAAGNPTLSIATNPILPGTGSVTIPTGTTAQRPGSPTAGMTRFNTTLSTFEYYNGTTWKQLTGFYVRRWYGIITGASGNTTIPWDNTPPLITEGTQLFSQTITPLSTESKFEIQFMPNIDSTNNNRYITLAVFRDNTCICVSSANVANSGRIFPHVLHFIDEPATTTSFTYSLRVGIGGGGGSWFINSSDAGRRFDGLLANDWIIREFV